jgi:hypothetical protein
MRFMAKQVVAPLFEWVHGLALLRAQLDEVLGGSRPFGFSGSDN